MAKDSERHFLFVRATPTGKSTVSRCKYCSKEVTWTSNSRLSDHLAKCEDFRKKHPVQAKLKEKAQAKLTDTGITALPTEQSKKLQYLASNAVIASGRPFSLFEHSAWDAFFAEGIPGFKPPDRKAVTRLLPTIYKSYRDEVLKKLRVAPRLNLIFDASDNIASNRIINIAVQIPNGAAFYWKTFDTGDIEHTAEEYINLIWPQLEEICESDWTRINSICTDTDSTMRTTHEILSKTKELGSCFFSLCDSHGLQLLIKDVLLMECFAAIFEEATNIVRFFSKSKLQLSRLRACQKALYSGKTKAFIKSVITRWGSQYNALLSVLANRDALRAYARRKDVHIAREKDKRLVLLPPVLESINSGVFWDRLEAVTSVLAPVSEFQHASEADRSHIGHVVPRWLSIKARWKDIEDSKQYTSVPWEDIYRIWKARFETQTYPIHFVANALRPETIATLNEKLAAQDYKIVIDFLKESLTDRGDYREVIKEFNDFRNQRGILYSADNVFWDCEWSPEDAWGCLEAQGSKLATIAVRIFGILANSVPSERSFSAINYVHTKARNRLSPVKADWQCFVWMNCRVLERQGAKNTKKSSRWDQLDEKEWKELEDSYMQYFCQEEEDTMEGQAIASFVDDENVIELGTVFEDEDD